MPFLARQERFDHVGSTNDVVRSWLAGGTPEVCLAVADEQTAGRGRAGRTWTAPRGAALLCSLGFRPAWLEPGRAWRLGAAVGLAMAGAAEQVAGLPPGIVRLKWPNDLVLDPRDGEVRKLAGVLGESEGLGEDDPRVVVGIGVNVDWAAVDFPSDLRGSMTSLREAAGRPVDRDRLLETFLGLMERGIQAMRDGVFDAAGWSARQLTTGRDVRIEAGGETRNVHAVGVDVESGALRVVGWPGEAGEHPVHAGEVVHVRLASAGPVAV